MDSPVFRIPDVRQAHEIYSATAERHYLVIRDAMMVNDTKTVGNHQLRLLGAGLEIPTTLDQCNTILEKDYVTKASQ